LRKVLMVMGAWERELGSVGTASQSVGWVGLTRWVRNLERARLGEEIGMWGGSFADEEEVVEERKRIWRFFGEMGEAEVVDFVQEMDDRGEGRLGLRMRLARFQAEHRGSEVSPNSIKRAESDKGLFSPTDALPKYLSVVPELTIHSIRSTLDCDAIQAYIDLYVLMIDHAYWTPHDYLDAELTAFWATARCNQTTELRSLTLDTESSSGSESEPTTPTPLSAFTHLHTLLSAPSSLLDFFKPMLTARGAPFRKTLTARTIALATGTWKPLVRELTAKQDRDFRDVWGYVLDYERKGGFEMWSRSRLVKQVLTMEKLRKRKRMKGRSKGKMSEKEEMEGQEEVRRGMGPLHDEFGRPIPEMKRVGVGRVRSPSVVSSVATTREGNLMSLRSVSSFHE